MGKYNRSQIMKNAWRQYKYVGKKRGQSFSDCLKASWKMFKMHAAFDAEEAKIADEIQARKDAERRFWKEKLSNKAVKADYNGYISHTALYGREFVSGGYCGD